jgi:YidC/Oxa1 family membrane protein insertase
VIAFLSQLGSYIMTPLYYLTSFVLLAFHKVFGGIFGQSSGAAWVLSIIGLTLLIRAALIPLFVKQIKSSRNMQLLQPKVKELQKKYGHDREKLAAETMALYKETGTNPFASCLPILLQMPIFLALFRLIDHAAKHPEEPRALLTSDLATKFANATLFGAKISDSFTSTHLSGVRVLAAILVIAMTATTFLTQRQLMSKNMPADAMTGQYAQQQKMLLYVLPVVFAVGGIAFPIGVLFYWTTSNLWTMCQQFYVIRNNPAPGTPAAKAKQERDAAKRERKGLPDPATPIEPKGGPEGPRTPEPPRRQQPKKQTRSQRKKQGPPGARPAQPSSGGTSGPSGGSAKADPDEGEEPDRKGA